MSDPNTPIQYQDFSNTFCGGANSCDNISIPLTAGWVYDTKDSALNPTRGALQRAGVEVSPGGDLKYYKLTYQHQRFWPLFNNMVFMANAEFGYGKGLAGQEVPFYKNFYAGGVGSVRGYDTASLGPYEIDHNGDTIRLGGTKRVVFNAELSMPVPGFGSEKALRFGPFFDAGQVYPDKKDEAGVFAEGPIRMSTGVAATWISPFGPLKLSIAQPINDQNNDKIQRIQFQMGTAF
jgi:outer membrane protein insertion porin family